MFQDPGYDSESGLLYLSQEVNFPEVGENPSKDDALYALEQLLDLLKEFPFVGEPDKSVAIATILTVLVRRSLPSSPLFAFSAPAAGTGKSCLVDVASIIATGESSAVSSQGTNEEEMEKRLGTALLEGNQIINIDNVEKPLKGQVLCQMLTQPSVKVRILGQSKSQDMPSVATVFTTGNNLVLQGDLIRRALLCRLDAVSEKPEERHFKRNIFDHARENRGKLVQAALTILKAYHKAGKPNQNLVPMASFEDWSNWIRGSLVWLGLSDPMETKEEIRSADSTVQKLKAFVEAWHEFFGSRSCTLKDAVNQVANVNALDESGQTLYDAIYDIAGTKDRIDTKLLGN